VNSCWEESPRYGQAVTLTRLHHEPERFHDLPGIRARLLTADPARRTRIREQLRRLLTDRPFGHHHAPAVLAGARFTDDDDLYRAVADVHRFHFGADLPRAGRDLALDVLQLMPPGRDVALAGPIRSEILLGWPEGPENVRAGLHALTAVGDTGRDQVWRATGVMFTDAEHLRRHAAAIHDLLFGPA
jgi:hypothetical protein